MNEEIQQAREAQSESFNNLSSAFIKFSLAHNRLQQKLDEAEQPKLDNG